MSASCCIALLISGAAAAAGSGFGPTETGSRRGDGCPIDGARTWALYQAKQRPKQASAALIQSRRGLQMEAPVLSPEDVDYVSDNGGALPSLSPKRVELVEVDYADSANTTTTDSSATTGPIAIATTAAKGSGTVMTTNAVAATTAKPSAKASTTLPQNVTTASPSTTSIAPESSSEDANVTTEAPPGTAAVETTAAADTTLSKAGNASVGSTSNGPGNETTQGILTTTISAEAAVNASSVTATTTPASNVSSTTGVEADNSSTTTGNESSESETTMLANNVSTTSAGGSDMSTTIEIESAAAGTSTPAINVTSADEANNDTSATNLPSEGDVGNESSGAVAANGTSSNANAPSCKTASVSSEESWWENWTSTRAPPGTPCVFGADERDEGVHCINDEALTYGRYGWCYTSKDQSSWGSCGEDCPTAGAELELQAKLGDDTQSLKGGGSNRASAPEALVTDARRESASSGFLPGVLSRIGATVAGVLHLPMPADEIAGSSGASVTTADMNKTEKFGRSSSAAAADRLAFMSFGAYTEHQTARKKPEVEKLVEAALRAADVDEPDEAALHDALAK